MFVTLKSTLHFEVIVYTCKQIYYNVRNCYITEVKIFEKDGSIESLDVSITMMNHRHR